jgi:hypothetical protein
MKEAMGTDSEDDQALTPKDQDPLPLQSGISGFAVDEELGFVCVLSPDDAEEDDTISANNEKFVYAVVSPTDKNKLSSAEGLCLVQLAGGLDLGAAVFPPETLARLVAAELDEEEINVEELRSKVNLLGVTVLKNDRYAPKKDTNEKDEMGGGETESSPERDAKIEEASPGMLPAVRNLPGLAEITLEQIVAAMKRHADANGKLDREGFSELLGTLRGGNASNRIDDQKVKFRITAILKDDDNSSSPSKLVDVDQVPAFQAIALSLRYKVKVTVSEDCFDYDDDDEGVAGGVLSRFPAFKPSQELVEDAQVMDGFISSMFFKKNPPKNDDKA